MSKLVAYVAQYGVFLVFANVFVEQVGIPIPALPTLIVAGSLDGIRGASTKGEETQQLIATSAGRLRGCQAAGGGERGSADACVTPR